MDIYNPIFNIDFYKVGHINQYPAGTTKVWSNWTPRTTRVPGVGSVVNFGFTYLAKKYLQDAFDEHFFKRPLAAVLVEYTNVIRATLGDIQPRADHISALHKLGYLPIKVYSLPEGSVVPLGVPPIVITNTHDEFYWLPNYLETLLSNIMWKPCTSATTARRFRKLFLEHARRAGETDFGFVDYQGHDFSFRGMSGVEDAVLSGMGHLLSFSGTDTIPAILAAHEYYGAPLACGGSVPATEHSVMCAGSQDGEFETFKRLLTEVYPTGIVSIVSDTWDLWKVLTDYIPRLKDVILARDGKIVIRPDSGDPVKIVCGDSSTTNMYTNAGAMRLLADALGTTARQGALPLINKGGIIYGDAISLERADAILNGIIGHGLSPYNMVFGIGSYTYEYVTRDTYGWAMKATAVEQNGVVKDIFKKPVTDDGGKFSRKGRLACYVTDGNYAVVEGATQVQLDNCSYQVVFENSDLYIAPTFAAIRERVREGL